MSLKAILGEQSGKKAPHDRLHMAGLPRTPGPYRGLVSAAQPAGHSGMDAGTVRSVIPALALCEEGTTGSHSTRDSEFPATWHVLCGADARHADAMRGRHAAGLVLPALLKGTRFDVP